MNDMKNKEFITIGKFNRLLDAYSVASKIESEGVECFLPEAMLTGSSHNHFNGTSEIRLQVRKEDLANALRILNHKPFKAFDNVSTELDLER
jgi:hypothetical protein